MAAPGTDGMQGAVVGWVVPGPRLLLLYSKLYVLVVFYGAKGHSSANNIDLGLFRLGLQAFRAVAES